MDSVDLLIALAVQRLALGENVAAAKYANGRAVDDPIREAEVLDTVSRTLDGTGLQDRGVRFFRDQMEANKLIQRGLLKRWRQHPTELPDATFDITADLRPRLDRITTQMLASLIRVERLPQLRPRRVDKLLIEHFGVDSPRLPIHELRVDAAAIALRSVIRIY